MTSSLPGNSIYWGTTGVSIKIQPMALNMTNHQTPWHVGTGIELQYPSAQTAVGPWICLGSASDTGKNWCPAVGKQRWKAVTGKWKHVETMKESHWRDEPLQKENGRERKTSLPCEPRIAETVPKLVSSLPLVRLIVHNPRVGLINPFGIY
jgi:hypothetical protein